MLKGKIKFFVEEKGYGFITSNGVDVFFHFRQIITQAYIPKPGDNVTFEQGKNKQGMCATNIRHEESH